MRVTGPAHLWPAAQQTALERLIKGLPLVRHDQL